MTPALTREIGLGGLIKSFVGPSGPVRAVRGIDITVPVGQTIALLDRNGAGKSTTLDMLLGLARPDSGSVSVLGRTARAAVEAGLVGAMLQTGALIPEVSVRERCAAFFFRRVHNIRVWLRREKEVVLCRSAI
jgi:ABC-2 type transport system ATP-binding protein